MRIDLHCHTKATKKGESISRNISSQDFVDKIKKAEVKMVAITNHNEFDLNSFNNTNRLVQDDFILLPGIELDIKGVHNERGHIIVVYDNKKANEFDELTNLLIKETNPNNCLVDLEDFIEYINKFECLVMAHYLKPDQLHFDSLCEIRSKIKNNYRFFYEPGNFRTLGIMLNHDLRVLKGTDHSDWNTYEFQDFATLRLEVDSYQQFMLFLRRDEKVIETLLERLDSYKIDISFTSNETEIVNFFNGINVLFGTKGTGKSVCLEKVYKYFSDKSFKVSRYSPDKNPKKLLEKLEIATVEKTLENYNLQNRIECFNNLYTWRESSITAVTDYKNYIKFKGKNKNKEKMLIVKANEQALKNEEEYNIVVSEFNNITSIINNLSNIVLNRHLSNVEIIDLNRIVMKLYVQIKERYIESIVDNLAVFLTNKSVSMIKNIVEIKTETKTIPSSSRLMEFIKNRLKLEINIKDIIKGFEFTKSSDPEFVGYLEENKKLEKKTIISMLTDNSSLKDGFTGINNLKEIKKTLLLINQNILKLSIEGLDKYREIYETNAHLSLDSFIGVKKIFEINGFEYEPSVGEATMVVLDESLNSNYDVYILDEPEKSLGNNYISEVLLNKIADLGKSKKTIVIATHNANIAVLCFPYKSILKVYNNAKYITYVGSPFTNKLKNIADINDVKNWKEESVRILEGGKEVFAQRGEIYE